MSEQTMFDLNASANEYVFARIVEDYNNQALSDKKPLITATQGRKLRQDVSTRLAGMRDRSGAPLRMETATRSFFLNAVNDALQPVVGGDVVDRSQYAEVYTQYANEYFETLAWPMRGPAADRRRNEGIVPAGGHLPISPFDPRFAHRSTVLSHGTEILYANTDEMLHFVPNENGSGFHPEFSAEPSGERTFGLYQQYTNNNGVTQYRQAGMAYTAEDASGLSRIRSYLSDSDYQSVASWMNVPAVDRMSPEAMERSAGILQMLQEHGIPYTVSKDRFPGQLKANISNTKISVRLTDTKRNESFIGRVYKDGHSFYMRTQDRNSASYQPTIAETQKLIEYAIGEHPDRENTRGRYMGQKIGSPAFMKNSRTGGQQRLSYVSMTDDGPTMHTMVGFTEPAPGDKYGKILMIHSQNNHTDSHRVYNTKEEAETFLRDAVTSARENFMKAVDVERLAAEAREHGDDEEYVPLFSGDASIAPIQQTYWDVLTGKSELYQPESTTEDADLRPIFEALGLLEPDTVDEPDADTLTLSNGSRVYTGTPEEKVQAHLNDSMDLLFGTYEPDAFGVRFNPGMVSAFMDSSYGLYRNNDNLVAAMYKLEFDGHEVRGTDFQAGVIKDRLVRFDEASARPMKDLDSPFMQSMFDTIKSSIVESACRVNDEDIRIDKNGIVSYTAYQMIGRNNEEQRIDGQLGQIFEPDKQGVVETHYNGSQNKLFSPGYDAYIVPETPETAGQDLMTRVRLRGMEQIMKQNISETIRYDMISTGERLENADGETIGKVIGTTTSVNNTYRGLYSTVYQVSIPQMEGESLKDTYIRQAEQTHLPKEILDARFETAKGLIHFSKDVAENSTVSADYFHHMRSDMSSVHDLTNDNCMDAYELTGRTNMAITQNHSAGYTDPVLTGSGKNQGIVRYLAEGTQVTPDGKIIPSENPKARAPLMTTSPMRYCENIPADRVQMVGSNYLTASGVAGMEPRTLSDGREVTGVGMAQLTLQGLTFDDGAVISSDFAKNYGVVKEDGSIRPLQAGDKICDFAGNKSIVAKVIDRNMPQEEADAMGIGPSVALFKANPDLDVVQAPYSAVSRFNAASAKLLMEQPADLHLPDGTVKEGCIGFAPVIITHHTAHEHTRQYDEDDVQAGRGRKVSAQLAWALSAKNATHLMDEAFSGNNSAVSNFREVLNVMGLDMDETGTLRKGYAPHQGEERYVFQMPDAETIANTPESEIVDLFRESVDSRGGFMEIPFPMTLPSGVQTQVIPTEKSAYPDRVMYALPVMSSHMRSGQTFEDGASMIHDYTNQYVRLFKDSVMYMKAEQTGNQADMARMRGDAETAFSSITDSLRNRKFDTKHNAMRDDFMSHRMPHSATAVWTPDTNLALNEVAMNQEMMKNLGVKRGDYTMIWRDPILRDYGAKYMKVVEDDSLIGISVNPLVAIAFDGDFDGDSAGMWAPSWQSTKDEAMRLFSFEMNMLDTTKVRENGDYALMINDSMDVISAEVARPELKERRMELEHAFNEVYKSDLPYEERLAKNRELLGELTDWAHETLCPTVGTEIISYKDLQSHAASLNQIVDHKAKGNPKKLGDYFKYFGATFEKDEAGRIRPETMIDQGHTLATEEDVADTELATAIKSHGTGNAGTVSQRVVTFARNLGVIDPSSPDYGKKENALSAALKTTYLSTQGLLQAKHDPVQAQRLYEMVQSPVRNIWRGRAMEAKDIVDANGDARRTWVVKKVRDADGNQVPQQATKDEWMKMFLEIHEHKDGLDLAGSINPEHVRQVADALYNKDTGRMYDVEDEATLWKVAAPMDILAYRTKNAFETICKMADEHRNIFEGTYNQMFAPRQIRENMTALEEGRELRPITSRDTDASYNPVRKSKSPIEMATVDASVAATLQKPEAVPEVPEPEAAATKEGTITFNYTEKAAPEASAAGSVERRAVPQAMEEVAAAYEHQRLAGGSNGLDGPK